MVKVFGAALAAAVILATSTPAFSEPCPVGGVPGLANVARRLHVAPSGSSQSALNACDGRAYEIGSLLSAALSRIEKLEAAQLKGKKP